MYGSVCEWIKRYTISLDMVLNGVNVSMGKDDIIYVEIKKIIGKAMEFKF